MPGREASRSRPRRAPRASAVYYRVANAASRGTFASRRTCTNVARVGCENSSSDFSSSYTVNMNRLVRCIGVKVQNAWSTLCKVAP